MATQIRYSILDHKSLLTEYQNLSQQHHELLVEISKLLYECVAILDVLIREPSQASLDLYLKTSAKRQEKNLVQEKMRCELSQKRTKLQTQFGIIVA